MKLFNLFYLILGMLLLIFLTYSYFFTSYTKSSNNYQKAEIIGKDSIETKKSFSSLYHYTIKCNNNQISTFNSYYENYKLKDSLKVHHTLIGIYAENDMSSLYPIFGIIFFTTSLCINRKILLNKKYFFLFLISLLFVYSCTQNENYSKLETMFNDINNTENTTVKKVNNKLVVNYQVQAESIDYERYTSKSAIISAIYNNYPVDIDTFSISIKCGKNSFSKEYRKSDVNRVNQCFLSLSPILQLLTAQKYSDFLIAVLKKSDNAIILNLNNADIDLGRIEKIDLAGFVQKDNTVIYTLILKRGAINNRLDIKVDISKCEIIEFDM